MGREIWESKGWKMFQSQLFFISFHLRQYLFWTIKYFTSILKQIRSSCKTESTSGNIFVLYIEKKVKLNYTTTHYHPPLPTTTHSQSKYTHHHPPPPTTSQNISSTTTSQNISTSIHHHSPTAKIYPPPLTAFQNISK